MKPNAVDDLKTRLASMAGYEVIDGKDRWPVGEWCQEAVYYITRLEEIVNVQNNALRRSCRPIQLKAPGDV